MAMSTTSLIIPFSSTSLLHIKPNCKLQTRIIFNPISHSTISKHKYGSSFLDNRSFGYFSNGRRVQRENNSKMDFVVNCGFDPAASLPPNSWKSWVLGAVITIVLPFFTNKWGPLFTLTKRVEAVVDTIDHVTEVIEDVAEGVEKVADEIADQLPEGGKLRGAIEFVENAAKEIAKDAHLAEEIIDKVEEVEKEVESFMKPVNDQANQSMIKPTTRVE